MIKITKIKKYKNKLSVHFVTDKTVEKYFNSKVLIFRYDLNINLIPNEVLIIPAVGNLITVPWFVNCKIYIPFLDKVFYQSICKIFLEIKKKYKLKNKNLIEVGKLCDLSQNKKFLRKELNICLYSGGIDSTALLFDYVSKKPKLLIADYEPAGIHKKIISFAKSEVGKSNTHYIKSNIYSFLNRKSLDNSFGKYTSGSWWSGIQHGMALLSLAAPISWKYSKCKIRIASTHDKSFNVNWGSQPSIDNNLKWFNSICSHEHFNFTRFEKVKFKIKNYYLKKNKFFLAVCNSYARNKNQLNCSKCPKCAQAILVLIYNNINPNLIGFKVNDKTFDWIKECLETKTFFARSSDYWVWLDLKNKLNKKHINRDINYNHPFFKFFEKIKLSFDEFFNKNLVITERIGYKDTEI